MSSVLRDMTSGVLDVDLEVQVEEPEAGATGARRGYSPARLKTLVVAADGFAILAGMAITYVISRRIGPFDTGPATKASLVIGTASVPLWLVVFCRYRLYVARVVASRTEEISRLVHAVLMSALVTAGVAFLTKERVSRGWLVLCVPVILTTCWVEREAVRAWFDRIHRSGLCLRSVVLVGANAEGESIRDLLQRCPHLGYRVVAVVDDAGAREMSGMSVRGRVEDTLSVVESTGATGAIIATTAVTAAASNRLVRQLINAGVHVELSSSLQGITSERLTVRPLATTPLVYVEPVHCDGWRAVAKRTFDVVSSAVGLILLSPALAVVAVAIKLDSKGRVFFSQTRVGRNERPFRVHKFRTMVENAEELLVNLHSDNQMDGPLFKIHDDPRITRVGRILRRFSLDEIPQLWNVLAGEMSLVGPRPALYSEMEQWTPELLARLRVRPGLTGIWQVSGRSNLSFADYIRFDLDYVENWSLWRDLAIVAKTLPVVLGKQGAY